MAYRIEPAGKEYPRLKYALMDGPWCHDRFLDMDELLDELRDMIRRNDGVISSLDDENNEFRRLLAEAKEDEVEEARVRRLLDEAATARQD